MSPPRKAHSSEQRGRPSADSSVAAGAEPRLFDLTTPADPALISDTSVVIEVGVGRENVANLSPRMSAHHTPTSVTTSYANNIYFRLCWAPFVSTVTDRTRVDISWGKRAARVSSCR
jgi:hypothetical protein